MSDLTLKKKNTLLTGNTRETGIRVVSEMSKRELYEAREEAVKTRYDGNQVWFVREDAEKDIKMIEKEMRKRIDEENKEKA